MQFISSFFPLLFHIYEWEISFTYIFSEREIKLTDLRFYFTSSMQQHHDSKQGRWLLWSIISFLVKMSYYGIGLNEGVCSAYMRMSAHSKQSIKIVYTHIYIYNQKISFPIPSICLHHHHTHILNYNVFRREKFLTS